MKLIRALALLLALALPTFAHAVITSVQIVAASQQTTATPAVTVTSAVAGNGLVVYISRRGAQTAPTDVSDSIVGAWDISAARGLWFGANSVGTGIYFYPNHPGGSPIITVTFASSDTCVIQAQELSSTAILELEDSATGSSSAATSHPLSTNIDIAGAGIALLNSIATSTLTETVATGFTALGDGGFRQYGQYRIVASGGLSTDGAWTSASGTTSLVGLSLREAAGASSGLLLRRRRN